MIDSVMGSIDNILLMWGFVATMAWAIAHFAAKTHQEAVKVWESRWLELNDSHDIACQSIREHLEIANRQADTLRAMEAEKELWKAHCGESSDTCASLREECSKCADELATERAISEQLNARIESLRYVVEWQATEIGSLVNVVLAMRTFSAWNAEVLNEVVEAYAENDEVLA